MAPLITPDLKRPSTQGTPFSTNYTQIEESMLIQEHEPQSRNFESALASTKFHSNGVKTGQTEIMATGSRKISRVHQMVLDSYIQSTNKGSTTNGNSPKSKNELRRLSSTTLHSRNK